MLEHSQYFCPTITRDGVDVVCWRLTHIKVMTFDEPKPVSDLISMHQDRLSQGLAFLVAVDLKSDDVLGYIYLTKFRPRAAYSQRPELTLFCHHELQGRGIETLLVSKLLVVVREPEKYPELQL